MVPVGLIRNLKIDVGGVKKMMFFTVIDFSPIGQRLRDNARRDMVETSSSEA